MATVTTGGTQPPAPVTVNVAGTATHFLRSKRFWGAIVAMVGLIAKCVQQGSVGNDDWATGMGILVALYGGIVATGPLTTSTKSNGS